MGIQAVPLWVPLAADGITQVQHPAELLRALQRAISPFPGVVNAPTTASATNAGGGFAATVVPAAMQLTVAAGSAFIPGREAASTLQQAGSYFVFSEASETITWPANASGSTRMDSLILRVADPQYGSIGGSPLGAWWDAVPGSSGSARPDSDFLSGGAKYIPGAWLRMYDISVPNAATQLTQGNVAFKAGYSNIHGDWPYFSAGPPTVSPLPYGQIGFEVDTGTHTWWQGSAFNAFARNNVIAAMYYTGGTGATSAGATEAALPAWTASNNPVTLLNAHAYFVHVRGGLFSSVTGATEVANVKVRTAVASTVAQQIGLAAAPCITGSNVMSFDFGFYIRNSTGGSISRSLGITVARKSGTGNHSLFGNAAATDFPLMITVSDLGYVWETQLLNVATAVT
jgi:hypothetical protein